MIPMNSMTRMNRTQMNSMTEEFDLGLPTAAQSAPGEPSVWLIDSFSFTPWYTAALAQSLSRAGSTVRLVSGAFLREPAYFRSLRLQPDAGPVHFLGYMQSGPLPLRRALRIAEILLNTRALILSLRDRKGPLPQILHFQQMPMLNHGLRWDFSLIDAAQSIGIPVVHTVHNLLPHGTGELLRSTYADLYRRVDHLVCHSWSAAHRLAQDFDIPERRISIIPHGPLFAPQCLPARHDLLAARERLQLPSDRPIVLCQGVLAEYKGLDVLLRAWRICLARWNPTAGPKPLLLIAGNGPRALEAEVRRAAAEAGDSVRADIRYISTGDLPAYFTAADILVYPYRSITTSGALLTGLSYARPIVASRLAPFQDYLVDGDNALLVKPEDPAALADSLQTLLLDWSRTDWSSMRTDSICTHRTAAPAPANADGIYARLVRGAERNSLRYTGWAEIADRTINVYRSLAAHT